MSSKAYNVKLGDHVIIVQSIETDFRIMWYANSTSKRVE